MQTRYERKEQSYYSSAATEVASDTSPIQINYRSSMAPRAFRIQRSRPCGGGGSDGTRSCENQRRGGSSSCLHLGIIGAGDGSSGSCGKSPVGVINAARQRDKDELIDLNDKFAQYVEQVRSLEALNRTYIHELDQLRKRTGQSTSNIEDMYNVELVEAKKLIDETAKEAGDADRRKQQNAAEYERMQGLFRRTSGPRKSNIDEIEELQRQIAENDAKIALLRRRLSDLEDELRIYKSENQRLTSEINRVNNDIHCEKLLKAACDSEKASADNEFDCLKQIYEEELTEIRAKNMISVSEPSNLFKKKLVSAIQDIRNEYESSVGNFRQSLKLRYKILTDQHSTVSTAFSITDSQGQLRVRMHEEWLSIRNSNEHLRARNRTAENSLADAKQRLADLLEGGRTEQIKFEKETQILVQRRVTVEEDYKEVQGSRVTLEEEINQYRRLLATQTTFGGYLSGGGGDFSTSSSVRRVVGDEDRYKRSSVTYATSTSRDYYGSRDSLGAGSSGLVQGSTGGSNTYQRFESGSRRVEAREEGSTSSFVRQGLASNYSSRENIISQSATSPRYSAVRDSSLTSRNRQSFPPPSDDDEN